MLIADARQTDDVQDDLEGDINQEIYGGDVYDGGGKNAPTDESVIYSRMDGNDTLDYRNVDFGLCVDIYSANYGDALKGDFRVLVETQSGRSRTCT